MPCNLSGGGFVKLNFWQWIGVVLLVVGGGLYIYNHYIKTEPKPTPNPSQVAPATSATPIAAPATQPG
jgi:hypothetical protein